AKLDSHLLELARNAGCDLWRPAKVTSFELNGGHGQRVNAVVDDAQRAARCRWIVDATGRAAMFARKLGHFRPNTEHPINAVWARFSGVKEWDSYEWRERFPDYANDCRTPREWATNHLFGRGWWVWIIPLQGGDVSAGIVYDSRIFKFPDGQTLGERLHTHILKNPVGREMFGEAKVIEGDVHALSMLPYHSEKVCCDGWAMVGDADLMSAALLLDVSSYYIGLVQAVYRDPEREFLNLPFTGIGGKVVRSIMNFYNRRLTTLANRRCATGYYGKSNASWRELYDGFVPDTRLRKHISRGLRRWWKCELINLALMLRRPVIPADT